MTRNFREGRRIAALAVAAAAMLLLGTADSYAQAIGFSAVPLVTTNGPIDLSVFYVYNSSGGTNGATRNSKGNYTATFPGLGDGLNSNVQVTAEGRDSDFCGVQQWGSGNDTDAVANITCYNRAGRPADSAFTVLYQARTRRDATKAKVAFVWADQASADSYTPDPTYQFNFKHGTNTVTRSGPGNYTVYLPGLTSAHSTALVTAYGGNPTRCSIGANGWGAGSDGIEVNVNCTDVSGARADERFSLVYSTGETFGYGPDTTAGAAIWANNELKRRPYTPARAYSIPIGTEPMTVQKNSRGNYTWTLQATDPWGPDTFFVSAYGDTGNYCKESQLQDNPPVATILVSCFDGAGRPADTKFTATFQTAN